MGKTAAKYTDESLQKYARSHGLMNICCGLALAADHLFSDRLFSIGSFDVTVSLTVFAAMMVICPVIYLASKNIPVKKETRND